MKECVFCRGDKVSADGTGNGMRPALDTIQSIFSSLGVISENKSKTGIHLLENEENGDFYLCFDNSAGEYADGVIKIKYCPFCGGKYEIEKGE